MITVLISVPVGTLGGIAENVWIYIASICSELWPQEDKCHYIWHWQPGVKQTPGQHLIFIGMEAVPDQLLSFTCTVPKLLTLGVLCSLSAKKNKYQCSVVVKVVFHFSAHKALKMATYLFTTFVCCPMSKFSTSLQPFLFMLMHFGWLVIPGKSLAAGPF